jgi:hypothetical protein
MLAAAVAAKLAVVAPAATATEAGTVSEVLLLASVTLSPPVGAAELKITVQLEAALLLTFTGLQVTDEMVGTMMLPPVPETVIPVPVASTPTVLVMFIAAVTALVGTANCMMAAAPEAIILVFNPASRQVIEPNDGGAHDSVFPAVAAAEPTVTLLTEIWPEG